MSTITEGIRRAVAANRAAEPKRDKPALPAPVTRPPRRPRPKKLPPLARIDALVRVPFFAALRPSMLAVQASSEILSSAGSDVRIPDQVINRPGRPSTRGWRDAMSRFTALGYIVVPVPGDPPRVTLASPGGRAPEGLAEVFNLVSGWIAAGLAGEPWPCAWCDVEAVTILVGNVPACEKHQS